MCISVYACTSCEHIPHFTKRYVWVFKMSYGIQSSDLEVNRYVSVLHLNNTLITIMNPCGKRSWHRQTTIYALILSCITRR